MFIPFISRASRRSLSSPSSRRSSRLSKRKGGGGGGGHGGGGGRGGSGRSSSSKSSSSSSSTHVLDSSKSRSGFTSSGSSSNPNQGFRTSTYTSSLPIPQRVIPSGQIFAGRTIGGGSRNTIFGTRKYGSGYPGVADESLGTAGKDFPFAYWPIAWSAGALTGYEYAQEKNGVEGQQDPNVTYLNTTNEYGDASNTTRPGGALTYFSFTSLSNDSSPDATTASTFYVFSDNSTISSLLTDLQSNCSIYLSAETNSQITNATSQSPSAISLLPTLYADTPKPEQVIQYYRASSIALALDSYNNSATYSPPNPSGLNDTGFGAPDSPLPSLSDTSVLLMQCLNQTIGLAAPIPDSAFSLHLGASASTLPALWAVGMLYFIWAFLGL